MILTPAARSVYCSICCGLLTDSSSRPIWRRSGILWRSSRWLVGRKVLRELSGILGLFQEKTEDSGKPNDALVDQLMELLIDVRQQARKQKDFAMADVIRDRLSEIHVTLEDRPNGTTWRME